MSIDYDLIFNTALKGLRQEGRYRIFNNITRKKAISLRQFITINMELNQMLLSGVAMII